MTHPDLNQTVAAAKGALSDAKRALNAGLRAQADTTQLREALLTAQAVLTAAEDAEQAATRAAREAAERAERAEVEAAQDAATAGVVETIQRIDVAPDVLALPEPQVDPAVAQAAANVVRTEAELARALEAVAPAEAESSRLGVLLREREAAEAAIRQRRLTGDLRETDAAELHLAAQDVVDLRSLVAEADAKVDALRPSADLQANIERARDILARVKSRAILDGQLAHVRRLEAALIAAVRQLGTASQGQGIQSFSGYYTPSPEIRAIGFGGRI